MRYLSWLAAAGLVMTLASYPAAHSFANSDRDRDRNGDGIPDRYQQSNQPQTPPSLLFTNPPDPQRNILGPSNIQDAPRSSPGSPTGSLLR